jgi:phosphate acyltransferase
VKIAVDAMGGDNAPHEIVKGVVEGVRELGIEAVLVGPEETLLAEAGKWGGLPPGVTIRHAPDVITTHEAPVQAVRRKKESSLAVAMRLVKDGEADAFLSAGSTGALMAAGLFILGRMSGIDRPGLGGLFPAKKGSVMVIDIGANVDNKPEHLVGFAIMGSVYVEQVLGKTRPTVALLSNGTEEEKGNELTKAAHTLLKRAPVNFVGNVEARELPSGEYDVVVCDGFVGNVVLKLFEGVAMTVFHMVREALTSTPLAKLGALLARPALLAMRRRIDYQEYGGVPLLGLNAPVVKCHGSSTAKGIRSGMRVLKGLVEGRAVERIAAGLAAFEAAGEATSGPAH